MLGNLRGGEGGVGFVNKRTFTIQLVGIDL